MLPSPPSPSATTTLPAVSSTAKPPRALQLHAHGPLLRDLTPEGERLLALRLLALAKLLGLHQVPDEPTLLQLAAFAARQFPDLTEAEVTHAVERWAAGSLAADVRLYGALSMDWLGSVLHAWREERLQSLRTARRDQERREAEAAAAVEPQVPDEFHDQLVRRYVAEHGELPLIAHWDACWRHLRQTDELPNLTHDQRTAQQEAALAELEAERERCRLTGKRADHLPNPADANAWHAHLRARRVREYYQFTCLPTTRPTDPTP